MRILVVLSLAGLVLIGCGSAASSEAAMEDEEAIRQLLARAAEANNQSDAEALAALFSEDAIVMPQGSPAVAGRAAILAGERRGNSEYDSEITITPVEVVITGDWAFARTRLQGTKTPIDGGEPVPVDAKELVIFRRHEGDGWRVARLIGNTNRPSFAWHSSGEQTAEGSGGEP